jgi:hypothetical protein
MTLKSRVRELEEENSCLRFNATYLIGAPVRFWTGLIEGPGRTGKTYTDARIMGGSAVVYVRDDAGKNIGAVCLSHIKSVEGGAR